MVKYWGVVGGECGKSTWVPLVKGRMPRYIAHFWVLRFWMLSLVYMPMFSRWGQLASSLIVGVYFNVWLRREPELHFFQKQQFQICCPAMSRRNPMVTNDILQIWFEGYAFLLRCPEIHLWTKPGMQSCVLAFWRPQVSDFYDLCFNVVSLALIEGCCKRERAP